MYGRELAGKQSIYNGNSNHQYKDSGQTYFLYKLANTWAADFIPLDTNSAFQLFYLLNRRDKEKHGECTPWYRVNIKDFVNFTEQAQMLPRSTEREQDAGADCCYVKTFSADQRQNA